MHKLAYKQDSTSRVVYISSYPPATVAGDAQVVLSLRSGHAKKLLRPLASSPATAATAAAAATTAASDGVQLDAQERSNGIAGGGGGGGGGTTSTTPTPASTTTTTSRATTPPPPLEEEMVVPVRLVTNGLWPVVADNTVGSCCPTVDVCGDTSNPAAKMSNSERRRTGIKEERGGGRGVGEVEDGFAAGVAPGQGRSIANTMSGSSSSASATGGATPTVEFSDSVSAASVAREVAEIFDSVSVALNTADPEQYEEVCHSVRVR